MTHVVGTLTVKDAKNSVNAIDATRVRGWLYAANGRDTNGKTYPHSTQYMSFTTPLSVPDGSRCGRFVFSDSTFASSLSAPAAPGCGGVNTCGP